jgi:glycosyltransferase involved in cell wall biosynthesis
LRDELQRYYPGYRNEVKILRFACSLPTLKESDYTDIRAKYGLTGHYLISPNQFWEHKNQATVIESLRILASRAPELNFDIVFTGSMSVNRGKGRYAALLMEEIEASGLSGRVKMLGVIDRYDQLVLMKNAYAILQPSLYEGWSTLVEEAKALNKHILVSDIPVHREQLSGNCTFFNPLDAAELADKIIGIFKDPPAADPSDYQENIRRFADDILDVLLPPTKDLIPA